MLFFRTCTPTVFHPFSGAGAKYGKYHSIGISSTNAWSLSPPPNKISFLLGGRTCGTMCIQSANLSHIVAATHMRWYHSTVGPRQGGQRLIIFRFKFNNPLYAIVFCAASTTFFNLYSPRFSPRTNLSSRDK